MKNPRKIENAAFIVEYGRRGQRHVAEAVLSTFSEFNVEGIDTTKPFVTTVEGVPYRAIPKLMS